MEKTSWTDSVRNEEVLSIVVEDGNMLCAIKEGRLTGWSHPV
jgi:hypothetical protein